MNMTENGLVFAGLSSIGLGIFHIPRFWGRVFPQWDVEVGTCSLLTRKLIHTVLTALCLTLAVLGFATLLMAPEAGELDPRQVLFLFFSSLFWIWRLIWQILYFPYRQLNPGKGLLSLHIALIAIFAANAAAYLVPVVRMFMS